MPPEERQDHLFGLSEAFGVGGSWRGPSNERALSLADSATACGVPMPPEQAEQLYRYYDLAARICELPVEEALSDPWEYRFPDDEDLEEQICRRLRELDAVAKLQDAQVFGRVHGDCFLYLAVKDGTSEDRPLGPIQKILYLRKIERRLLSPKTWYQNPLDPKFGEPETYLVGLASAGLVSGQGQVEVHETRFLKLYGARTSDQARQGQDSWHDSVLQRVSAVLADFALSWASASKLLTNSIQGKFKIKDLINTLTAPGGPRDIETRLGLIDRYRGVFKSVILDAEGEDFEYEVASLASLPELLDRFASRLAAATGGIPVTKLFGISPAGMNATGESDAKNWYRILGAFRRDRLQPQIERLTELLLEEAGHKRDPNTGEIDVEWSLVWPELDRPSEKEKAELRLSVAQTDKIYIEAQVLTPPEVSVSRFGGAEGWSMETTLLEADPGVRQEDLEAEADQEMERQAAVKVAQPDPVPDPARQDMLPNQPRGVDGKWAGPHAHHQAAHTVVEEAFHSFEQATSKAVYHKVATETYHSDRQAFEAAGQTEAIAHKWATKNALGEAKAHFDGAREDLHGSLVAPSGVLPKDRRSAVKTALATSRATEKTAKSEFLAEIAAHAPTRKS